MFAHHSRFLQAVLASPTFSRVSGRQYGAHRSEEMRMLRNSSFAPAGLSHIPLIPRAYALGCILAPLRGCDSPGLRHYLR